MAAAMEEIFLAIFTTLAPMGAGAFVILMLGNHFLSLTEDQQKKLDKYTFIPLIVVVVAFGAAFLHLKSPLGAIGVFAGVGSSPLSNEIMTGVLFFVVAGVYTVLAFMGKLNDSSRKWLLIATVVLAFIFSWFIGLAYKVVTIPSWSSILTPVETVCFMLFGGSVLGYVVLNRARVLDTELATHKVKSATFVLCLVGFVGAFVALIGHVEMVSMMWNPLVDGVNIAATVSPCVLIFGFLGAVAVVANACIAFHKHNSMCMLGSLILVTVAIFVARMAFYAMQISIGL